MPKRKRSYSSRRGGKRRYSSKKRSTYVPRTRRQLTKYIKNVIDADEPLVQYNITAYNNINPYYSQDSLASPYRPASGCYSSLNPRFYQGVDEEQKSEVGAHETYTTLNPAEISGNDVYVKGFYFRFVVRENSTGLTPHDPVLVRFMVKSVLASDQSNIMGQDQWSDTYNFTYSGNAFVDVLSQSLLNKDNSKEYKSHADSGWKRLRVKQTPPYLENDVIDTPSGDMGWTVDPMIMNFWVPIKKRFKIAANGTLHSFVPLNWCVLSTIADSNLYSPDCSVSIDMHYTD